MIFILAVAGFAEASQESIDEFELMMFEMMLVPTAAYLLIAIAWIYYTKGRFSDHVANSTIVILWMPLVVWFHVYFIFPYWWYPYHDWPIVISLAVFIGVHLLPKSNPNVPTEMPPAEA